MCDPGVVSRGTHRRGPGRKQVMWGGGCVGDIWSRVTSQGIWGSQYRCDASSVACSLTSWMPSGRWCCWNNSVVWLGISAGCVASASFLSPPWNYILTKNLSSSHPFFWLILRLWHLEQKVGMKVDSLICSSEDHLIPKFWEWASFKPSSADNTNLPIFSRNIDLHSLSLDIKSEGLWNLSFF